MNKSAWFALGLLLLCLLLPTPAADQTGTNASPAITTKSPNKPIPGVEAAQALSTITGVAMSPLLGVSAVGAWRYWHVDTSKRGQLPWFAQPYFWVPALLLLLAVFVKDAAGTALPASLKKPFDVLEVFENKISALVATGAFVPLIASIFRSVSTDSSSWADGMGLAMVDLSPLLNLLAVPLAMAIFLIVWLVAHVINVLILISPFGIVDAALKSARLCLMSLLTLTAWSNPYLGAALSVVIIVICYFLSGWAFRLSVFGTVFGWDLLTMGQTRFKPDPKSNWAFTARRLDQVPVRTYGKLSRDDQGRLVLTYRRWLVLPVRMQVLPSAQYAVGRGLLYPELMQVEGEYTRTMLDLPPRYRTHEHELAAVYGLPEVQDVGVMKGLKAVWRWLKDLLGFKIKRPTAGETGMASAK